MELEKTPRGFPILKFQDGNGEECTLQESSAMHGEVWCWLGCSEIGLKRFTPGPGWEDIELDQHVNGVSHVANNRMHLSQSQVRELLPYLQRFAETGEIK